jgi:hypothetical protein
MKQSATEIKKRDDERCILHTGMSKGGHNWANRGSIYVSFSLNAFRKTITTNSGKDRFAKLKQFSSKDMGVIKKLINEHFVNVGAPIEFLTEELSMKELYNLNVIYVLRDLSLPNSSGATIAFHEGDYCAVFKLIGLNIFDMNDHFNQLIVLHEFLHGLEFKHFDYDDLEDIDQNCAKNHSLVYQSIMSGNGVLSNPVIMKKILRSDIATKMCILLKKERVLQNEVIDNYQALLNASQQQTPYGLQVREFLREHIHYEIKVELGELDQRALASWISDYTHRPVGICLADLSHRRETIDKEKENVQYFFTRFEHVGQELIKNIANSTPISYFADCLEAWTKDVIKNTPKLFPQAMYSPQREELRDMPPLLGLGANKSTFFNSMPRVATVANNVTHLQLK